MTLAHKVEPNSALQLSAIDPSDTGPFEGKEEAVAQLERDVERLSELQEKLYAEQKQSLLVVLQAVDTAGKDGVIRKVIGPLDSRGVHVWSFKAPTEEERAHDFLWRIHQKTPRAGEIVLFNRSHYEDVLVVRAFGLVPEAKWSKRYAIINEFERNLVEGGTRIVKLYLHISKSEQKQRLQERLDDPTKRWKFDPGDLKTRAKWDDFRVAYQDALSKCSTPHAPWYVVPANKKWFRDAAVARVLVETLESMNPQIPAPSFDPRAIVIPD